ncbi:acyl-ACP--UDP-N-acetylglucosamine O-acyltransferase [Geobacter sp. DSM 9736]|uniref:acyl-ACP--UDP-N-acetylglucosamine O-acyltransferase n=1 Tax=Geobacter sp. DSM 9736 TaxID=1277350 RepID=UPI000B509E56|nr:acyl-ACP--UDP-N-acetylglucosamine O-acyltransferase [Geobacter sp. DSM 9736]SNB45013.1 acyl-[acyl-carrier-protein]--UDP-N-acetylglucosamine O-acyltransferase [Geobacter sp. DSM 9736]
MIHSTAVIHPTAELAENVEVGPYVVIGPHVRVGQGTKIGAHTVIESWTELGEENIISHMASIGAPPQDLKYRGEETWLKIGDRNIIREFSTLHRATTAKECVTSIGSNNMFMAYSHVAHDCKVGSNVIMANCATLAGHVTIEDSVTFGGLTAVHQFTRIGSHVMVGGGTLVGTDVPPYTIATGGDRRDAQLRGLNLIGLKRRGFPDEVIASLKTAYKILVLSQLKLADAIERIKQEVPASPEVNHFIEFIEHPSQRGICRR